MNIERVRREERTEFINMLNRAFSNEFHTTDFFRILPKMCRDTAECAGKHLGIRENGQYVAGLGVYPLPARICGEKVLFSTMGNVGTVPEARGKGYMSELLSAAMEELNKENVDASRLGGKPARYNRYGYHICGTLFRYHLDAFGSGKEMPEGFHLIERENETALLACKALLEKEPFYVERETVQDFYESLIAWENLPYTYEDEDGRILGYVSMSRSLKSVAEIEAADLSVFREMITRLCGSLRESVSVDLLPHRLQEKAFLDQYSHSVSAVSPSLFKILHLEPVMRAFLKLKAYMFAMEDMEQTIEILGEGTFRVGFCNGEAFLEKTDAPAEETYSYEEALPVIFATYTPNMPVYKSIFPLPLSWNGQDRV